MSCSPKAGLSSILTSSVRNKKPPCPKTIFKRKMELTQMTWRHTLVTPQVMLSWNDLVCSPVIVKRQVCHSVTTSTGSWMWKPTADSTQNLGSWTEHYGCGQGPSSIGNSTRPHSRRNPRLCPRSWSRAEVHQGTSPGDGEGTIRSDPCRTDLL